ncbi:Required for respiratory growth protein 9 mitochondrial [Tieghemiomyces parasiticus]|uniref:Required for respiratory growth protein 9, mitochondrial n=1 Tax=Tieghemiomyces parasiticus TaxID=78921 RepID=A0A9W7ZT98_9FUNG|nr:Required for respiratory growth protein 9 mitochondrial [Tieghemiomyces parasiticus]
MQAAHWTRAFFTRSARPSALNLDFRINPTVLLRPWPCQLPTLLGRTYATKPETTRGPRSRTTAPRRSPSPRTTQPTPTKPTHTPRSTTQPKSAPPSTLRTGPPKSPATPARPQYPHHPDFPAERPATLEATPSEWGQRLKAHHEAGGDMTYIQVHNPLPSLQATTHKARRYAKPGDPKKTKSGKPTPGPGVPGEVEIEEAHEGWRTRRVELKKTLSDGQWKPTKRVARSTMDRIRFLAANTPDTFTIPRLSHEFKISFEAVRRILKSKFEPSPEAKAKQEEKRIAQRRIHVKEMRAIRAAQAIKKEPALPKPIVIPMRWPNQ